MAARLYTHTLRQFLGQTSHKRIHQIQRTIDGDALKQTPDLGTLLQFVAMHDLVHVVRRQRLSIVAREDDGTQQEHEQTDPAGDGKTQRQQLIEQFLADDVQQHFRRPPSAYVTS